MAAERTMLFDASKPPKTVEAGEIHNGAWQQNQLGGNYNEHARFTDDALAINVPAGFSYGHVGLQSCFPLIWCDQFSTGASITLTITCDPARTSGIGVALSQSLWTLNSSPYSMAGAILMAWQITEENEQLLNWNDHSTNRGPIRKAEPIKKPNLITMHLTEKRCIIDLEGFEQIEINDETLHESTGLYVSFYTAPVRPNQETSMAIKTITMECNRGESEIPSYERDNNKMLLPIKILFPPSDSQFWLSRAFDGGDFSKHAVLTDRNIDVTIPSSRGWPTVGIATKTDILSTDDVLSLGRSPYQITFLFDPLKTTGLKIVLRSGVSDRMIDYSWFQVWFQIGDEKTSCLSMRVNNRCLTRPIQKKPGDKLIIVISDQYITAQLSGGKGVALVNSIPHFYSFNLACLSCQAHENEPTSFSLKEIQLTRLAPPDMTKAERWRYISDNDFDPDEFIREICEDFNDVNEQFPLDI